MPAAHRFAFALALLVAPVTARAQPAPLPPLPPDTTTPPPSPPPPSDPARVNEAPPPGYGPSTGPLPPYGATPAPIVNVEPPSETHAPKFSFWTGARLGVLGFGNSFYDNESGQPETTGNFLKPGLGVEIDAGARLGKRYTPYIFLEHGFVGKGHRFAGTDSSAASDLFGIGFRYTAGDVDSAGFLTEISVGVRTITVSGNGQTYKMSGYEIFGLGLGAEIRISTLFVISPMARLSGGTMSDTSGSATFAPNQGDGLTHPTYQNGSNIASQRGYLVLGLGCGAHFDLFGK